MTLRNLVLAVYAVAVMFISIIGWFALDFSRAVSDLMAVPASVAWTLAMLWGGCLALISVLVLVQLRYFVCPLIQLRHGALRIAQGDYAVRFDLSSGPEIGDLQAAFNKMAADLAARAQAEERHAASLAIFREMVNQSNDMLMVVDGGSGRFVDVNDAACRQLGYGRDQLLALSIADVDMGGDGQKIRPLSAAARAGDGVVFESVNRRRDGSTFPVEVSLRVVDSGGCSLAVAMVRDISERLTREEQLRLLLEATEDGIYVVDTAGRVTLCNRAAARMLGYGGAAELIGLRTHPLIHGRRADGTPYAEEACPLARALSGRQVFKVEGEVFRRKDGTVLPVDYAVYPMIRMDRVIGAVVSFADATARRSAEAALRHAQKMQALGSLTNGIAHEINNLLLPIMGLAGVTVKELPEGSRARLRLEKIADAAIRARDLIARLGAFSDPDGGGPRAPFSMAEVVARALAAIGPTLPSSVQVEAVSGGGDLAAVMDASAMETVVVNLVSNAVDAMAGAVGVLRIAVDRVQVDEALRRRVPDLPGAAYVRLTVTDSGTGMDGETMKRMFDPFFTTKEVGAGTGLGLSVVHGIVAAHGGAIAVSSELGQGTTVEIFLPA